MSWAGNKKISSIFGSLFQKEQAPSSSTRKKGLTPSQRNRIKKELEKWVEEKSYRIADKTLSEASARIGTNSLLLHRYFAELGIDFRTWRSRLRIEDAKEALLAFPEETASNIGRMVGIEDRSNFNRQFKAVVGDFPDHWRKNQK